MHRKTTLILAVFVSIMGALIGPVSSEKNTSVTLSRRQMESLRTILADVSKRASSLPKCEVKFTASEEKAVLVEVSFLGDHGEFVLGTDIRLRIREDGVVRYLRGG